MQELGPVTLYSDWGSEGGVAKVWENTGSVGLRSGRPLVPPMQCREVRHESGLWSLLWNAFRTKTASVFRDEVTMQVWCELF